jgi:hypothetical protein
MRFKVHKLVVISMVLAFLLSSIIMLGSKSVAAGDYVVYHPNIPYPNVRSCVYTPGGGVWDLSVYGELNTIGLWHPPPYEHGQIGVLEITETRQVWRVEVNGSGCAPPVTLTCNGISKDVSVFHDAPPYGYEVITYDISPPTDVITLYTTVHYPDNNHGFGIKWIKLYYYTPPAVGGKWVPINKFAILAPWIGIALVIPLAATTLVLLHHRRKNGKVKCI